MSRKILHRVLYGTTTPDPYQRDRLTIKPAILYGYSRHKLRFADYPAIIPAPAPSSSSTLSPSNGNGDGQGEHGEAEAEAEGPTVLGTLVTGLGDHDVFRLDIFEGDEYERQMVTAYPLSMSYPGPKHSILNDLEGNGHGNGNGNGNENENGGRRGAKEQGMQVETYVWIEERKRLEDSEWDFEEFVREKMGRWVGEGVKNQDIEGKSHCQSGSGEGEGYEGGERASFKGGFDFVLVWEAGCGFVDGLRERGCAG